MSHEFEVSLGWIKPVSKLAAYRWGRLNPGWLALNMSAGACCRVTGRSIASGYHGPGSGLVQVTRSEGLWCRYFSRARFGGQGGTGQESHEFNRATSPP